MPQIERVFDEVGGEAFEQRLIDGGIRGSEVIDRFDEPAPHEVIPNAIDLGPREERVVRARDPVGQRIESILIVVHRRRRCPEKERPGRLAGAGVVQLALAIHPNHLLADELVSVRADLAPVLEHLVADAGEEGVPAVVVLLRPPLERMVVALGTPQPNAEKELRRGLTAGQGIAQRTVVVRGRIAIGASSGRDQLTCETVERFSVGDALADPAMQVQHALAVERVLFGAQQVRPLERPTAGEFRPVEKAIDQPSPLVGLLVGNERPGLVAGGQDAEQIEVRAPHKRRIPAHRRRIHSQSFQFRIDVPIDIVDRHRLAPHEIRPSRHEGDANRNLRVQIADQNRRLPETAALHQTVRTHRRQRAHRRIHRLFRSVARRPVGEPRRHAEPHRLLRSDQDAVARRDLQTLERRRGRRIGRHAPRDPITQHAIRLGVNVEATAPFVRDLAGRLEQHQAPVRIEPIDPAPQPIAREHKAVEVRVLAAQRQLEAALAVEIPVADARIATGLGQHRHHVITKRDRFISQAQPRSVRERERDPDGESERRPGGARAERSIRST